MTSHAQTCGLACYGYHIVRLYCYIALHSYNVMEVECPKFYRKEMFAEIATLAEVDLVTEGSDVAAGRVFSLRNQILNICLTQRHKTNDNSLVSNSLLIPVGDENSQFKDLHFPLE